MVQVLLLISLLSPLPRPIANLARLFRGLATRMSSRQASRRAGASLQRHKLLAFGVEDSFSRFLSDFCSLGLRDCAFLRAKGQKRHIVPIVPVSRQATTTTTQPLPFSLALACLESIHPERVYRGGCRGHCTARPMRSVTGGGSSAETGARCECQCVVECQCLS